MTSTLDPAATDLKVVDADTHLTERHDLWTSRAPAGLQDRMPHVERIDGEAQWVIEGENRYPRIFAGGVTGETLCVVR